MPPIPTGRFAPTPSGPLHFGSLVAALASYLNVKHKDGYWYVRIDDIDTPRIANNAVSEILEALEFLGLEWDSEVYYQSAHLADYQHALSKLQQQKLLYACTCSRKQIGNSIYNGKCRELNRTKTEPHSLRIKTDNIIVSFADPIQGNYSQSLQQEIGDFIVFRSDKIFSYHLSTVIDDANQGITEIVRGFDLLESTPRQLYLRQKLELETPEYFHIPVASNTNNEKLSKQTYAPALDKKQASVDLFNALSFLQQKPDNELIHNTPEQIVAWAIKHWDINNVSKQQMIIAP